ncbi:MAG: 1-acyl-sn-glycerol-3-phosphate acyltransferase [Anaerolineales bacterium]|nr:1-acyl-sn-glycerol-3-phosphate acyltransferase [Anaerolineales bacterium]
MGRRASDPVVDAGHVVGMFPEGTRSRDGSLQRWKTGAARIALTAQCLVVPAMVINLEPVLRDFLKFKRRPAVIMRFGAPFILEGDAADPQRVQQATTKMMLALAALLPAERRGYYADAA